MTSEHGAAFFKVQQPVSLVIPPPPHPNVATQDARPAISEQVNEDFGIERDVEELQNEDETDESMLSGEQHIIQTSPDVISLEPHYIWAEVRGGIGVLLTTALVNRR